MFNDEVEN
jgi:transposase InsO family protein